MIHAVRSTSVPHPNDDVDGLVQDCSNSIANALELQQFCLKTSNYTIYAFLCFCLVYFRPILIQGYPTNIGLIISEPQRWWLMKRVTLFYILVFLNINLSEK